MRRTALVTGITGQDGAYLAKFLLEKDYKVYGLIRRSVRHAFENLEYLGVDREIEYLNGDMTDESSLIKAVHQTRPDEVYNLAAQSFVGASWEQPHLTTQVNSIGVLNLLEAVKLHAPRARFYQASTSEMFGNSGREGLQTEDTPFHPRSPYAIAKLYAYWIVVNYRESYAMYCVNGILFNHESPIRGKEFVSRKVTDGVARIKLGLNERLHLGNLDSQRDWGFAGDFVEAMWRMLQQPEPKNYIVATGETHTIRELVEVAFRRVGIEDWEPYVFIDPAFKRPAELYTLRGDNSLAQRDLNWQPRVRFKELVEMMVDADLKRVEAEIASGRRPTGW
ncbi:MAG TPA: GDP-mannose 4,6-dehydratase [Candidatus Sumerlaeota bacterium]|nr:GDP-mannose 4,6-dehydratase [Candidatus Sumerlaeota bacterium]